MSMIEIRGRTDGLEEMEKELLEEVITSGEKQVGEAAAVLGREMKRLLSKRRGPSRPGEPPAREADWLWKGIGWSRAKVDRRRGEITSSVGLGFGRGYKALNKAKAAGVNPFEYAWTLEFGGIIRVRGSGSRRAGSSSFMRIEPRPFARVAEAKVESEVVQILTIY